LSVDIRDQNTNFFEINVGYATEAANSLELSSVIITQFFNTEVAKFQDDGQKSSEDHQN
jgi:hypothetical protein